MDHTVLRNSTACRNCRQFHADVPGYYTTDCIMLGSRSHSSSSRKSDSSRSSTPEALTTIFLPNNIREQALLFDQIWFWFLDIKHENDGMREHLAGGYQEKGSLKSKAPLQWLQWKRCDGTSGQTRNQENFEKLWKTFTGVVSHDGTALPVAWVTLRAMKSDSVSSPLPQNTPPASPQSSWSSVASYSPPARPLSPVRFATGKWSP